MRAANAVRPKAVISARRMAVFPHLPWHWRLARLVGVLLLIGAAVAWAYTSGSIDVSESDRALAELRAQTKQQHAELAELRAKLAQSERQLQIERIAAADLAKQVKQLAFDSSALREDLAVFQSLAKTESVRAGGISLNRLRLQPGVQAGEYRYQMLIVQGGQRKEFRGHLEFAVDVQRDGRKVTLRLPLEAERDAPDYRLDFKFFQRVDGTFNVAPDVEVKSMQVRVFEDGSRTPKLTQTVRVF